jgi:hypothetical protein
MALHRDIFWVGRQWAVTGSGIQAVDQRRRSEFDIDILRLWDDGLCDRLREHTWFVAEDFEKALAMARARYPAPPRKTAAPDVPISRPAQPAPIAPPQPAVQTLKWRLERASARFLLQWRVRR